MKSSPLSLGLAIALGLVSAVSVAAGRPGKPELGEFGVDLSARDLVGYCEQIAAASGGMLGIGRVSSEERALIARIASEVKGRA